jgi:signal transduction histidine kinase
MTPLEKSLLIVDDEEKVLDVLAKTFEEYYHVYSAQTALQALEIVKHESIQVIITDERMPQMDGMTLLKESKKVDPQTVNIILTAYTDINVAIEAINSGIVYRYIVKPWETDELKTMVRQAFERHDLLEQNRSLNQELLRKNRDLEENLRELKDTQEKLVRNEKFTLVGQLTASIGHELRNPLSRIGAAAALLKNDLKDATPETKELFKIIDNEVAISNKIINDLLDFSRERKAVLKLNNLNEILTQTLSRLRFPEDIVCEQELDSQVPEIYLDEGQIQQVLINLILNSIQAMSQGGKIYLKTQHKDDHIEMVVKDTGSGIPDENIGKIFDPLFTTKSKGIGLGMYVVKMLTEKNNGSVSVHSRENIGTTVTLAFPTKPPDAEK